MGVTVFRLCPQRLDDFLSFFDSEAFRDKSRMGNFCYCQCFLEDHSRIDWARRKGIRRTATWLAAASRQTRCKDLLAYGNRAGSLAGAMPHPDPSSPP